MSKQHMLPNKYQKQLTNLGVAEHDLHSLMQAASSRLPRGTYITLKIGRRGYSAYCYGYPEYNAVSCTTPEEALARSIIGLLGSLQKENNE